MMTKITAIGGIFLKAEQPKELLHWYRDLLGMPMPNEYGGLFESRDYLTNEAMSTVFSTFPKDTNYFDPSTSDVMINMRVDNLDAMLQYLRSNDVQVMDKVETYDYGRFGWCIDPEGNKIELWEPVEEVFRVGNGISFDHVYSDHWSVSPKKTEYADLFQSYIQLVPPGNLVQLLIDQKIKMLPIWKAFTKDQWNATYDANKWSVAQVIQHIIDTERILSYRILSLSRQNNQTLNGFDQDIYANETPREVSHPQRLLRGFQTVRDASISLLETLDKKDLDNYGSVEGRRMTVRALGFVLVGHLTHHQNIIDSRYL